MRTLFYFLLLSSEKCTELQKVLRSNQKPASGFHSNLVSSTDPFDAIKTEDIYTHQIFIFKYLSLMSQITATGFLLNYFKTSNRTFWSFAVFLCISIKYYSYFSCAFICSYNWKIFWFLGEFFSLYAVIFSRHHFYHLINKYLDVSYMKWLLHTADHYFFYYFKSHLIFKTHHLLLPFIWSIFYVPKFSAQAQHLLSQNKYWCIISVPLLKALFGFPIQVHPRGVSLAIG